METEMNRVAEMFGAGQGNKEAKRRDVWLANVLARHGCVPDGMNCSSCASVPGAEACVQCWLKAADKGCQEDGHAELA